jgi:hypothetical protein
MFEYYQCNEPGVKVIHPFLWARVSTYVVLIYCFLFETLYGITLDKKGIIICLDPVKLQRCIITREYHAFTGLRVIHTVSEVCNGLPTLWRVPLRKYLSHKTI